MQRNLKMSNKKIVHVVGTGTIGEPLIGLLCDYSEQLGIDQVTFNKNSALKSDRSKVINLLKRGASSRPTPSNQPYFESLEHHLNDVLNKQVRTPKQ